MFFISKQIPQVKKKIFLAFMLLVGISATYFWGHMLVADALASYFLILAYILLFLKIVFQEKIYLKDVAFISIFSALGLLTSLTYSFVVGFLSFFTLVFYFRTNGIKFSKKILTPFIILVSPYIGLLLYLLASGSFQDYLYQSVIFTKDVYVYNYPRAPGVTTINPIRYAIIIAHEFYNNFYPILTWVKNFDFSAPFNITLALTNVSLLAYLVLRKKFSASLLVLLFMIYVNARSNPMLSRETDYQSTTYIMFSLFNAIFLLPNLFKELNEKIPLNRKILVSLLLILVGVYWFYNSLFLFSKFDQKVFGKYMGTAPLIYDRPAISSLVNSLLSNSDYYWIGPYEPEELLYVRSNNLASKYHFILPPIMRSEKIRSELLSDLKKNKPKLIVYFTEFSHSTGTPDSFDYLLIKFLNENYFTISELSQSKDFPYKTALPKMGHFDFDRHFFFDKNRQEEIMGDLLKLSYIGKK